MIVAEHERCEVSWCQLGDHSTATHPDDRNSHKARVDDADLTWHPDDGYSICIRLGDWWEFPPEELDSEIDQEIARLERIRMSLKKLLEETDQ